jgi:hypothetical protein
VPELNRARTVTSVTVSHLIVRACWACGHPRQPGTPCAGCGLTDPPVVHDLGIQAARYRHPVARLAWAAAGRHLAAWRARRARRYTPPANDWSG